MANQYVNKVVQSNGTTLIDISDTTAVASDVARGKDFYLATGEKVTGTATGGSTPAVSVVTEALPTGGDHVIITGTDLSNDTVTAETLLSGYTAHDSSGQAIVGTASGGSTGYETGTITLESDWALTTSGANIPGLQLSFQPDFFYIIIDRPSFTAKTSPTSGFYGMMAIKKTLAPPFAISTSATQETVVSDYVFFNYQNVLANDGITTGYGINGAYSPVGTSYYSRYAINADGTVKIGRYSTASTSMKSGTYRYFACKL